MERMLATNRDDKTQLVYLEATPEGRLLVEAGAAANGGGSGGDASADHQLTQIALLDASAAHQLTQIARLEASAAHQLAQIARLEAVRDRLPPSFSTPGLLSVDTLGTPGAARSQATGAAAANIVLTASCRRISMLATAGTWYSISGSPSTASHYIAAGERLDFDVPANTTVSVLQETAAGSVRITELL